MAATAVLFSILPSVVWAHCDTESGPVAVAVRKALEAGNFATIAIWVGAEQEKELPASFVDALAVYNMGGKAKALAERYFMETAVRLHREAEGMPYTGLKPATPLPPDIAAAEKALATGDLAPLTSLLSARMEKQIENWFQKALAARKQKDESIEKGRKWVDAYVMYVIYIHGLYKTIEAGPEHGIGHAE